MMTSINVRVLALHVLTWLTPYAAVGLGLHLLRSAWASLLLYHGGIVVTCLVRKGFDFNRMLQGWAQGGLLLLVMPIALFGLVLIGVLPMALQEEVTLAGWLGRYGLSGGGLIAFLMTFALLNPLLEEIHWSPVRSRGRYTPLSHVIFAGYHVFVLWTLLEPIWLLFGFTGLCGISWLWAFAEKQWGGLLLPLVSHLFADVTIVIAVLFLLK